MRRATPIALLALASLAPRDAAGDDRTRASGSKDATAAPSDRANADADGFDNVGACRELDARNEREVAEWSAAQPPTKYQYPRKETISGAPWIEFLRATGHTGTLLAATLAPHVLAALRDSEPEPGLSWPWQLPIGAPAQCTRRKGSFDVSGYKPFRLLLEPGFLAGADRTLAVFVRPGLRYMYHPTAWYLGFGGGAGSMLELSGKEPTRASLSPELLLQFGACCDPGYVTLTFRREIFFAGSSGIWFASAGFTYF